MRKYLYLLTLTLLSVLPAGAQNLHFKFGGGLASHFGSSAQPVGAFKAGLGYELELDQHWSFTPTLEIYGKGWKNPNATVFKLDGDGNQLFDEKGNPLTGIMSRSASQNYLELPLLFSYFVRTGEARYIVFTAGPYVAYGISGKQKTKGDTEKPGAERYYYEKKTFSESGTHRFDYGVQTSVGYQFPSGVLVGIEADFGLARFNSAGDRNVSGLITVGYKLR